jgi:hypothetical protein
MEENALVVVSLGGGTRMRRDWNEKSFAVTNDWEIELLDFSLSPLSFLSP